MMLPLLEVRDLVKEFPARGRKHGSPVRAVAGVSFALSQGETFGLVGESGSGKTTTGRCVLRLLQPTSGEVRFKGEDVLKASPGRMRELRRHMQIVFQDPYSSLNPRMRVSAIVEEPLVIHNIGSRQERKARVGELLRLVGLDADVARRFPHEFSGGERQRVALARAIALEPSFIVADEPVSSLDVSVRRQIVDLLMALQQEMHITYLFIAHDLRLVEKICPAVAVMYRGRIVETGVTEEIFKAPAHPYTRALLSAVPEPDPDQQRPRLAYDPAEIDASLPLRGVGASHWAAV